MNPIVSEKISSFSIDEYRPIIKRELDMGEPLAPKAGNLVTVITGMRRSGKSYRLFQEIDRLAERGDGAPPILYFNFEDERLDPITPRVGDEALEAFYTMHPDALKQGAYLFFDELQEMDGWGKWLRRVVDTYRATIYVTGSSSKMFSREVGTEFRERSVSFEQAPFSFREFAASREPDIDLDRVAVPLADRLALQRLFGDYLSIGGFPAVQGLSPQIRVQVLQSYVQRVVAHDVIERHNLANPQAIALFAQMAVSLNGRALSLRKAENALKSRGMRANRAMLSEVLGYLEDAFLVHVVRERSRLAAPADNSLRKIYAVDPGLYTANAPASTVDTGQRLEQAVYLELRRRAGAGRRDSISFMKTHGHGYEVDFAVGDALFDDGLALYQVSSSVADAVTRERETRALWEAMDECGCDRSTLIVLEGVPETIERAGKRIETIPAWDWMRRR